MWATPFRQLGNYSGPTMLSLAALESFPGNVPRFLCTSRCAKILLSLYLSGYEVRKLILRIWRKHVTCTSGRFPSTPGRVPVCLYLAFDIVGTAADCSQGGSIRRLPV